METRKKKKVTSEQIQDVTLKGNGAFEKFLRKC